MHIGALASTLREHRITIVAGATTFTFAYTATSVGQSSIGGGVVGLTFMALGVGLGAALAFWGCYGYRAREVPASRYVKTAVFTVALTLVMAAVMHMTGGVVASVVAAFVTAAAVTLAHAVPVAIRARRTREEV